MELLTVEPQVQQAFMLPMKEVRLLPIGDLQIGTSGFNKQKFSEYIAWGQSIGAYYIGLGDYADVASPSNRAILAKAFVDLYESPREAIDRAMEEQLAEVQEILYPTIGRWFGLVSGHHYWEFQDGTTTDTRLAEFLETKYMGDGAAMSFLRFEDEETGRQGEAKVYFQHGSGGATTPGGALAKLLRVAQVLHAHVYLQGHIPIKISTQLPWIDLNSTKGGNYVDKTHQRTLAVCGGWMESWSIGSKGPKGRPEASYAERGMMSPTSLGGSVILIQPEMQGRRFTVNTRCVI